MTSVELRLIRLTKKDIIWTKEKSLNQLKMCKIYKELKQIL